jgi:hypothetical protein
MVTSSFIEQPGMKLELPQTQTSEVARLENLASISPVRGRFT